MPVIREPFVRQDYRGLNDAEARWLRRYLLQTDGPVEGLETQVRLGPGELLPDTQPDSFRRSWQESSKLKADAVIDRGHVTEIVELKDHIRTSPLGQVLSYRYWYEIERTPQTPVELVVTADDINPSVVQPIESHGVRIHVQTEEGRQHYEHGRDAQPPFLGP